MGFWVGEYHSRRENHDRIPLIPDKQEYSLGETASIFAALPFDVSTGLVTTERENIVDYKIIRTDADSQAFTVDLSERKSPNAYVSAVFVKPGTEVRKPAEFKQGIVDIKVDNPAKKLDIVVETNKEKYNPGEKLSGTISIKDGNGKPVVGEASIAMVDEAVWEFEQS